MVTDWKAPQNFFYTQDLTPKAVYGSLQLPASPCMFQDPSKQMKPRDNEDHIPSFPCFLSGILCSIRAGLQSTFVAVLSTMGWPAELEGLVLGRVWREEEEAKDIEALPASTVHCHNVKSYPP